MMRATFPTQNLTGCRRLRRSGSRFTIVAANCIALLFVGTELRSIRGDDQQAATTAAVGRAGGRFVVSTSCLLRRLPLRVRTRQNHCARPAPVGDETLRLVRESVVPVTGEEYMVDFDRSASGGERESHDRTRTRSDSGGARFAAPGPSLMVPSLNGGAMYHDHQGSLQTSDGQIERINLQSVYFGGGDFTYGSQTVLIPAVHLIGNVGDAYFAPLVAHQIVNSRSADSRGIENTVLLEVARRYLELVGSQAASRRSGIPKTTFCKLCTLRPLARTGRGQVGDYNPGQSQALLLHSREERVQETVAVASARGGPHAAPRSIDPARDGRVGTGARATGRSQLSCRRVGANGAQCGPEWPRGPPILPRPTIASNRNMHVHFSPSSRSATAPEDLAERGVWRLCRFTCPAGPTLTSTPFGRFRISASVTPPSKRNAAPNGTMRLLNGAWS